MAAYCREINATVDAQRFVDYYTANGWKVGGKAPMRDWKATVRNWHNNDQKRGPHRNGKPDIVERQGPALLNFIAGDQNSDS